MNARDDNGLVHEVDKYPKTHPINEAHLTQAGFTWCMIFFSWVGGPRFHPISDTVESRLAQTEDHPTCLECIGYTGPGY